MPPMPIKWILFAFEKLPEKLSFFKETKFPKLFLKFFTILLNCSPRSYSFLKTPKLAAPGESKITSPFWANPRAFWTASVIFSASRKGCLPRHLIIFSVPAPLIKIKPLVFFFTASAISPKSRFLSLPPAIRITFCLKELSATIVASGVVALVSL